MSLPPATPSTTTNINTSTTSSTTIAAAIGEASSTSSSDSHHQSSDGPPRKRFKSVPICDNVLSISVYIRLLPSENLVFPFSTLPKVRDLINLLPRGVILYSNVGVRELHQEMQYNPAEHGGDSADKPLIAVVVTSQMPDSLTKEEKDEIAELKKQIEECSTLSDCGKLNDRLVKKVENKSAKHSAYKSEILDLIMHINGKENEIQIKLEREENWRNVSFGIPNQQFDSTYDLQQIEHRIGELFKWHTDESLKRIFMAPYFPIIQSSGMGKTKLLYEYKLKMKMKRQENERQERERQEKETQEKETQENETQEKEPQKEKTPHVLMLRCSNVDKPQLKTDEKVEVENNVEDSEVFD
jgi:hypothetical protein